MRPDKSNKLNGWWMGKKLPTPDSEPTPLKVDAATLLAGLTQAEVANAVYWRQIRLPFRVDPKWAEPHLASLRPAWEVVQAQSVANGHMAEVTVTVDLSDGPLMEWLHRNVFPTFLQSASLYLHAYGQPVPATVRRVVAYLDGGGDMKTLMLTNITNNRVVTPDFNLIAAALTALVRFCATTNPEMDVDLMHDLTPYLVGSTPQEQWMSVDRALAYREAGVAKGEARRLDFGAAANRPTDEALATLAGLHGTSR